jgi:hypothetical protein
LQNELNLEFPTKSMPSSSRTAAILDQLATVHDRTLVGVSSASAFRAEISASGFVGTLSVASRPMAQCAALIAPYRLTGRPEITPVRTVRDLVLPRAGKIAATFNASEFLPCR